MSKSQVFVSFDIERDGQLLEELRTQASSSGFAVSSCSERSSATDVSSERVRRRIREADHVIFICSEHTESSVSMSTELRLAQQERTPYLLLWGRRETMCTKPMGAKNTDGIYGWTRPILEDQLAQMRRIAEREASALERRSDAVHKAD